MCAEHRQQAVLCSPDGVPFTNSLGLTRVYVDLYDAVLVDGAVWKARSEANSIRNGYEGGPALLSSMACANHPASSCRGKLISRRSQRLRLRASGPMPRACHADPLLQSSSLRALSSIPSGNRAFPSRRCRWSMLMLARRETMLWRSISPGSGLICDRVSLLRGPQG
jgi:hypothetical protein